MTKNKQKWVMLASATALLTLNFWAWSLLSPLAPNYAKQLDLSPFKVSLMLAVPVIIGSLGRIPLGIMTDRYGGRRMFAAVSLLASLPVIGLCLVDSYNALLAVLVCVGISGASFAVGVPYVNAWFPLRQRGLALGLYAIGDAGTALSGIVTPRLATALNRPAVFLLVAAALIIAGLAMARWGRNAPSWRPSKASLHNQLSSAFKWKYTWQLSLLYSVTFGAFVSLGLYLPTLLGSSYKLSLIDAASRAAGFVLVATAARPLGGWLSDRVGGIFVLRIVFVLLTLLAAALGFDPSLFPIGTTAYLTLGAALGIGSGAVFAFIGHRCDKSMVGAVTGIVGTAGGLGGFFPPLLLGASFELFKSYGPALFMLAAICLAIAFMIPKLFKTKRIIGY